MDNETEETIFRVMRQHRQRPGYPPPDHGSVTNGMHPKSTSRDMVVTPTTNFQQTREVDNFEAVFQNEAILERKVNKLHDALGILQEEFRRELKQHHMQHETDTADLKQSHSLHATSLVELEQRTARHEDFLKQSFKTFQRQEESSSLPADHALGNSEKVQEPLGILPQEFQELATDIADFKQNRSSHVKTLAQLEQCVARHEAFLKHRLRMPSNTQQQQHDDPEDFKKLQQEEESSILPADPALGNLEEAPQEKVEEHAEKKKEKESEFAQTLTHASLTKYTRGYTIQDSMWDSSILIGFDCISKVTWAVIVLGILMTIAIESSFILVVFVNYRYHGLDDSMLDGLLHWRAVVAHDIKNYDRVSATSLAARVCALETSTYSSTFQMSLFQDIDEFRNSPIDDLSALNGYYLCNLGLILWIFAIVHDLILNARFTCSVLAYDFKGASLVEIGDEIRIVSLNKLQAMLVITLVSLPRFVIANFLGYAGIYFLCYTSNLNDLLLNAVALVFILEIDEMLFYALCPAQVKLVARTVEPLHNPKLDHTTIRRRCIKAVEAVVENLFLRCVTVFALLAICDQFILNPFTDKLDLALKYLCSGNKDIVYLTNPVNRLSFYSKAPAYDAEVAHKMTYTKRAVLEIIGMDPDLYKDKVGNLPDAFHYENSSISSDLESLRRKAFGSRYYLSATAMCIDHTDVSSLNRVFPGKKAQQFYQSTELFFRDHLDKPSFESCSEVDFVEHCLNSAWSGARALCGIHCGCDNPWSGQFFAKPTVGCPLNCDPRWQLNLYYETPPEIAAYTDRCEDVPMEVLERQDSWNKYVLGLEAYLLQFEPEEVVKQIDYELHHRGCGYLTVLRFFSDICTPNEIFRSARYYCPATCMCASSDQQECPNSCKYALPHQKMSPGLACPTGLNIKTTEECEIAADEILQMVKYIDYKLDDKPAGCYLSHGKLIFANGTQDLEIPYDYISMCKSSQPFLPNEVSKGKFELGKHCADCILYNMACAMECYYGAGNYEDSDGHDDGHGHDSGHRILSEEWTLMKNGTKEIGEQSLVPIPGVR